MTLHAVIGEGSINVRELTHQLDDLLEKAAKEKTNFWFMVEGKVEPTKADEALMEYFIEKGVFVVAIFEEGLELAELYASADQQQEYTGDFGDAFVEAMTELQEDEEGADLLALLINPKEDDEGDTNAITVIEKVIDAGFSVYGLNDSMEEIALDAPEEEEPAPEPPKKAAAKKAAAPPKEVEAKEEDEARGPYTRAELEALPDAELKALANGMGITGRGRKAYTDGILGAQGGATEVSNVTPLRSPLNGNGPVPNASWLAEGRVLIVIHGADGRVQFKSADAEAVNAL